jgi:hypothetical protein
MVLEVSNLGLTYGRKEQLIRSDRELLKNTDFRS